MFIKTKVQLLEDTFRNSSTKFKNPYKEIKDQSISILTKPLITSYFFNSQQHNFLRKVYKSQVKAQHIHILFKKSLQLRNEIRKKNKEIE